MKQLLSSVLVLLSLTLLAGPVAAGFALTLSSPDNLSNLTVGQQVTFQVTLSGADASNTLDELQTDITWLSNVFSVSPSNIIPGSIVPDLTGFSGTSVANTISASGLYDNFATTVIPGPSISSSGLFFSVIVKAATAGAGSVTLANQTGFQGFNQITIADNTPGGGLDFTISPAAAVPAPPGMILAGSGAFLLLLGRLRAQRAQQGSIARILAALTISRAK